MWKVCAELRIVEAEVFATSGFPITSRTGPHYRTPALELAAPKTPPALPSEPARSPSAYMAASN